MLNKILLLCDYLKMHENFHFIIYDTNNKEIKEIFTYIFAII